MARILTEVQAAEKRQAAANRGAARQAAMLGQRGRVGIPHSATFGQFPQSLPTVATTFINPNYWYTERGQEELRQRGIEVSQEQIAELQTSLKSQAQGGEPQSQVAQDALSTLQAAGPLVGAGVLSASDLRRFVAEESVNGLDEQRHLREATADMEALTQGFSNDVFSLEQTEQTLDQVRKKYGDSLLMRVPGYAEFVGLKGQLQQARGMSMQEFAQSRGIESRFVRWDDRGNRPTFNAEEFAFEESRTALESGEVQKRIDIATTYNNQASVVASVLKETTDPGERAKLLAVFNNLRVQQAKAIVGTREEIQQQSQRPAAQPGKDLTATIGSTPASPVQQPVSYQQFNSREAAVAAAKNGEIPIQEVVLIEGQRAMLGADGKFRAAR